MTQENIPYTADEIKAMVKTIEELRKKYKEALERARELQKNSNGMILKKWLWGVFPELKEKESEDERTKKAIIRILKGEAGYISKEDTDRYIAWLENQCEQKTKPKFNVGDWITDGRLTCKVLGVTGKSYELHLHNDDYCHFETDMQSVDKYYHLWTIADAKDGDVLCCESGWTCIFKALNGDISFSSYCFMDATGWFCEERSEAHTLDKAFIKAYNGNIYPATKEQRDLLFSKMKEAGYEWDSETKEVKKIEVASKESEDEKTRKELIAFLEENLSLGYPDETWDSKGLKRWIAWLEKQDKLDNNDTDILNRFSFYSYKDEPNILYLSELYVNKEQRNKGIGTKILKIADKVAASMKCNLIRLKTEIGSNAERLYRKNGYNSLMMEGNQVWLEKQGEKKDYYTKQELIDMGFSFTLNGDIVTPDKMMEDMKKYLAWKEKHDEQKQADTPKFKVGDKV